MVGYSCDNYSAPRRGCVRIVRTSLRRREIMRRREFIAIDVGGGAAALGGNLKTAHTIGAEIPQSNLLHADGERVSAVAIVAEAGMAPMAQEMISSPGFRSPAARAFLILQALCTQPAVHFALFSTTEPAQEAIGQRPTACQKPTDISRDRPRFVTLL